MTTRDKREHVTGFGMTDEERWQAMLDRDTRYDGAFVCAITSTRIYCKPSCPSKKPHRRNVVFFSVAQVAEQSGFRACLRCRPDVIGAASPELDMVNEVCRIIGANLEHSTTLDRLASAVGISPYHLQRTFKKVTGISPREYSDSLKMGVLKSKLREGWDVTGAIYEAGFSSSSRVYEQSSSQLGMTPGGYRKGGPNQQIAYACVEWESDYLLVAMTSRGVCAVSLGDDPVSMVSALRNEYPAASLAPDNGQLDSWVREIIDHISGNQPDLDLPVDVRATAFERLVWNKLREIPYGQTLSYGEVARQIGQPNAARAVGKACASNPTPIVVPCHRVVRKDGNLGGYRLGVDRKKKLLSRENAATD